MLKLAERPLLATSVLFAAMLAGCTTRSRVILPSGEPVPVEPAPPPIPAPPPAPPAPTPPPPAPPPVALATSDLTTVFSTVDGKTVTWSVVSVQNSQLVTEASGTLDTFSKLGPMVAGETSPSGITPLYALDLAAPATPTGSLANVTAPAVKIYALDVTIGSDGKVSASSSIEATVPVALVDSATAQYFMARNAEDVVVGTSAGPAAVIDEGTFTATTLTIGNPAGTIAAITATEEPYDVITVSTDNAFKMLGNNYGLESGGTSSPDFVLNPVAAVVRSPVGIVNNDKPNAQTTALDQTIVSLYQMANDSFDVSVCGLTAAGISGCFGSYQATNFDNLVAMIGSPAITAGNTLTRDIEALDAGSDQDSEANIRDYTEAQNISGTNDVISFFLNQEIVLPLIGGPNAQPSMVSNGNYVMVAMGNEDGTGQNLNAVFMKRADFDFSEIAVGVAGNGGVVVSTDGTYFAASQGSGASGKYTVVKPDGSDHASGTGIGFLLNTINGTQLTVPAPNSTPGSVLTFLPRTTIAAPPEPK